MVWGGFFFCLWQLETKTALGQNHFSVDGNVAPWPSPQPAEPASTDRPLLGHLAATSCHRPLWFPTC